MTSATQTQGLTGTWTIDPAHTLVEFSGKHMMFTTVKGRFDSFQGILPLRLCPLAPLRFFISR